MRVKCLAQEHNRMSPARAQTRSARSGVERTNHEATAPPQLGKQVLQIVRIVPLGANHTVLADILLHNIPYRISLLGQRDNY